MSQWETDFRVLSGQDPQQQRTLYDQMGAQGWELVTIVVNAFERHAWFKRELPIVGQPGKSADAVSR